MIISEGPLSARICFVSTELSVAAKAEGGVFGGYERSFIERKCARAGFLLSDARSVFCDSLDDLLKISWLNHPAVIIPLGTKATEWVTGKKGIDKWHLSILKSQITNGKAIPTYSPRRIWAEFHLALYFEMALARAFEESHSPAMPVIKKIYHVNPPLEETIAWLEGPALRAPQIAVDTETGRGQINTLGIAISAEEAIAIGVLPDRLGSDSFLRLWQAIARVMESPSKKIFQNGPYDIQYLSYYGIKTENFHHDTMWCQKFLWPELEMGLDNIGRIYTKRPYWKDDGKSEVATKEKKDWGNIRDWQKHFLYNCDDTCGTFEGYLGQQKDLKARGLDPLFYNYVMKFAEPVLEMCARGVPIDPSALEKMRVTVSEKITALTEEIRSSFSAPDLNPASGAQIKKALIARGYTLPKKHDRKKGTSRDSTDEKSLKKLKIKHPDDKVLDYLMDFAGEKKLLSSYLNVKLDSDSRMRYLINPVGTETGRMSMKKGIFREGFNPQTVPSGIKEIFQVTEGFLLEIDLRQAESRFVAYDCQDMSLINMLEDPTKDIHSYVAAAIFKVSESQVKAEAKAGNNSKRQLGKKSGHGANYDMGADTFVESCLQEMNLVLTRKEAKNILDTYHSLFPGIRRGHAETRKKLERNGFLETPLGRVRHFYGRLTDAKTHREAYAYRPQSTIPDITNHLMLYLWKERASGKIDYHQLLQIHDSLFLWVPDEAERDRVGKIASDTSLWHPEIVLPGGRLIIPTEIKYGLTWGSMKQWST